ncbi:type I-B CRISPR-associated protein Cas5b [Fusobacterium sp.]|uniref:type I-B CRISPR-associated protein Cas5b n=1 Tax=Fusobacterium sp. TaxID=68766 RepID=UPI00396CB3B4
MEILKFRLNGKTAFFKNPEVNTYLYFSYGNIHKIAVLGILGAILGLRGYNHQGSKDDYPEFYEKLKDTRIAIVPLNKGIFNKKIQFFNNSVGYASGEEGGNLIVKEEWLENVDWEIYIFLDKSNIIQELKERILNRKFKYNIYLGKNDHPANIIEVEVLQGKEIKNITSEIASLFIKGDAICNNSDEIDDLFDEEEDWKPIFRYDEKLPYALHKQSNQYLMKNFIFTNEKQIINGESFIKVNDKIIQLF